MGNRLFASSIIGYIAATMGCVAECSPPGRQLAVEEVPESRGEPGESAEHHQATRAEPGKRSTIIWPNLPALNITARQVPEPEKIPFERPGYREAYREYYEDAYLWAANRPNYARRSTTVLAWDRELMCAIAQGERDGLRAAHDAKRTAATGGPHGRNAVIRARVIDIHKITDSCQNCGFDLRELVSGICPECNVPFLIKPAEIESRKPSRPGDLR
jgi:hypothetical protein